MLVAVALAWSFFLFAFFPLFFFFDLGLVVIEMDLTPKIIGHNPYDKRKLT